MDKLVSGVRRIFSANNLRKHEFNPAEDRLSANMLSSLLTAIGLLMVFVVTPRFFINPTPDLALRVALTFGGGVLTLIASYASQRGYHYTIANAAILTVPIFIVISSVTRNTLDALLPLYYLSPILIFVSLFLTERMMWISFIVNTLTLILSIALIPSIPVIKFMEGPFSFHLIVSTLTMLMVRHRTALEALRKRELQDSEARFRSVIDGSQDAFYLFAAVRNAAAQITDFKLIDSNQKAAAQLNHYPANGTTLPEHVRAYANTNDPMMGQRLFSTYKSVLETGQTQTAEVELAVEKGGQRWFFRQVLRVGDGVAVLMRDITPDKLSEQQTRELNLQQEKVSILHSFIQDASHDLRTPLAVMRTSSYLLNALADRLRKLLAEDEIAARRADLNTVTEKMQYNTEQVVQSSDRLHRLIEDMLEMASLDYRAEFALAPRSLNSVIRTLVDKMQSQAERKKLILSYTLCDLPLHINIDETAFSHALEHLLSNAIQFTPAGGQISLRIFQQGDQAIIEIKDTGIGIAPEEMPHIFERFYRADRARQQSTGGTGLGLPIAQKIIEAHGGKLTVESQVGQGTAFRVWIAPFNAVLSTPPVAAPTSIQSH